MNIANSDLHAYSRLIYYTLLELCGSENEVQISHINLANTMGLSVSTVRRYVPELVTNGLITVTYTSREYGGQDSNVYKILR